MYLCRGDSEVLEVGGVADLLLDVPPWPQEEHRGQLVGGGRLQRALDLTGRDSQGP